MNIFKILKNIIAFTIIVFLLVVLGVSAISRENLPINYKSLLVQSGSMEPTISAGDVIIITKLQNYNQYDVVTFTDESNRTVTHRVMEVKAEETPVRFVTKGDANRSIDNDNITLENIQGKAILTVPKIGYIVNFAKKPLGMVIMILVPVIIIMYDEVKYIFKHGGKEE